MSTQATELRYVVRFRVVRKYFGQLCLVLAALTLVPLVMSMPFGDTHTSLRCGIVIGGLVILVASLARLRVQANEGMLLVVLMFFFTLLVMVGCGIFAVLGLAVQLADGGTLAHCDGSNHTMVSPLADSEIIRKSCR